MKITKKKKKTITILLMQQEPTIVTPNNNCHYNNNQQLRTTTNNYEQLLHCCALTYCQLSFPFFSVWIRINKLCRLLLSTGSEIMSMRQSTANAETLLLLLLRLHLRLHLRLLHCWNLLCGCSSFSFFCSFSFEYHCTR